MGARIGSRIAAFCGAILALLGVAILSAPTADAGVEDFSYASWTSDYVITIDADGRSRARVIETLVARFPEYDQNRGIVRGLEERFEGADLQLRVISITDEHGARVPYDTDSDEGTLYLHLGTDDYVHGLTTYVIEYEMRDVIIATDAGVDEFYWNLLPLRSRQPIEAFAATITFSPELSAQLTGAAACYEGYSGSDLRCPLAGPGATDTGARFTVAGTNLPPGYGFTVAIALTTDTVVQPPARIANPMTDVAPFVLLGGGAVTAVGGTVALSQFRRRKRTATGIVIAQYDVPENLPPLIAAALTPGARSVIPAQIVHLAVGGVLRIEEGTDPRSPQLRLLDPARVGDPVDARLRDALFPGGSAGDAIVLPRTSDSFATTMRALQADGVTEASRRGLLIRERSRGASILRWVTVGLVLGAILLGVVAMILDKQDAGSLTFFACFAGVFILGFAASSAARHRVHSPTGAETYEYLQGVREFIRVAETDRLRMLQSHHGAERYRQGSIEVVHLYERLLPYAMLFGEERSWGRVLEVAYASARTSSTWMGHGGTSGFSSGLSSFSSGAQSASSYSSSSSGGSSGGGSSGGGGGGGSSGGR